MTSSYWSAMCCALRAARAIALHEKARRFRRVDFDLAKHARLVRRDLAAGKDTAASSGDAVIFEMA